MRDDAEARTTLTTTSPAFVLNVVNAEDLNSSGQFSKRPSAISTTLQSSRKKCVKGELRYLLMDVEPSSPRMVLSEKALRKWEIRLTDHRDTFQPTLYPALPWYAEQLSFACGRAMVTAPIGVRALQLRHNVNPKILDEAKELGSLLVEIASLFSAAAYHVERAIGILGADAAKTSCANPHSSDIGVEMKLPHPPFVPKSADGALADLHLSICKLQTLGPRLATILRQFAQSGNVDAAASIDRLLRASPLRGNGGAFGEFEFAPGDVMASEQRESSPYRLQQLFLVLPCVEEGMDRLCTLIGLADRLEAAKSFGRQELQRQNTGAIPLESDTEDRSDADEDLDTAQDVTVEVNVSLEDDQDLVEAALLSDGARNSGSRPSSALRLEEGTAETSSRPQSASRENQANASVPLQLSSTSKSTLSVESPRKDRKEEKSDKNQKKKGKKKRG